MWTWSIVDKVPGSRAAGRNTLGALFSAMVEREGKKHTLGTVAKLSSWRSKARSSAERHANEGGDGDAAPLSALQQRVKRGAERNLISNLTSTNAAVELQEPPSPSPSQPWLESVRKPEHTILPEEPASLSAEIRGSAKVRGASGASEAGDSGSSRPEVVQLDMQGASCYLPPPTLGDMKSGKRPTSRRQQIMARLHGMGLSRAELLELAGSFALAAEAEKLGPMCADAGSIGGPSVPLAHSPGTNAAIPLSTPAVHSIISSTDASPRILTTTTTTTITTTTALPSRWDDSPLPPGVAGTFLSGPVEPGGAGATQPFIEGFPSAGPVVEGYRRLLSNGDAASPTSLPSPAASSPSPGLGIAHRMPGWRRSGAHRTDLAEGGPQLTGDASEGGQVRQRPGLKMLAPLVGMIGRRKAARGEAAEAAAGHEPLLGMSAVARMKGMRRPQNKRKQRRARTARDLFAAMKVDIYRLQLCIPLDYLEEEARQGLSSAKRKRLEATSAQELSEMSAEMVAANRKVMERVETDGGPVTESRLQRSSSLNREPTSLTVIPEEDREPNTPPREEPSTTSCAEPPCTPPGTDPEEGASGEGAAHSEAWTTLRAQHRTLQRSGRLSVTANKLTEMVAAAEARRRRTRERWALLRMHMLELPLERMLATALVQAFFGVKALEEHEKWIQQVFDLKGRHTNVDSKGPLPMRARAWNQLRRRWATFKWFAGYVARNHPLGSIYMVGATEPFTRSERILIQANSFVLMFTFTVWFYFSRAVNCCKDRRVFMNCPDPFEKEAVPKLDLEPLRELAAKVVEHWMTRYLLGTLWHTARGTKRKVHKMTEEEELLARVHLVHPMEHGLQKLAYLCIAMAWIMTTWSLLTFAMLIREMMGSDAEQDLIVTWATALALEILGKEAVKIVAIRVTVDYSTKYVERLFTGQTDAHAWFERFVMARLVMDDRKNEMAHDMEDDIDFNTDAEEGNGGDMEVAEM
eukprot:gene11797-13929_t